MARRHLPAAWLIGLTVCAASAEPEHVETGFAQVRAAVGPARVFGAGIAVAQVESSVAVDHDDDPVTPPVRTWMPRTGARALDGQPIVDRSGAPPGAWSGHATSVARRIVGRRAMADTVATLDVYSANDWIGAGYLRTGTRGPPAARPTRVINHSWAGGGRNTSVLRRADWLSDRDEIVSVVGVRNAPDQRNAAYMAAALNAIVVGRSDGDHSTGSPLLDAVYDGRGVRPHLVAPVPTGSAAAATVTSAVIVLLDAATDPTLSQRRAATVTRGGARLYDAGRPEVIRAVLLAGADRDGVPAAAAAERSANGLDRRYGAGQIDIGESWRILAAGEQHGTVGARGFDYVPAAAGGQTQWRYRLPAFDRPAQLVATVSWQLAFPGGTDTRFDASAMRHDFDLLVHAGEGDEEQIVAAARGRADLTQSIALRLEPGRAYVIAVRRADDRAVQQDFAVAWRVSSSRCRGRRD